MSSKDPYGFDDFSEVDLSKIDLKIEISEVKAKPRKLRTGPPELKERDAIDRMAALGEGKDDPGQWVEGHSPADQERYHNAMRQAADDLKDLWGTDPEVGLVEKMAQEMADDEWQTRWSCEGGEDLKAILPEE